jgi:hypothetical protein
MARTSHFVVSMTSFSLSLRALAGGTRGVAASVIAPAPATEGRAERRPAAATFPLADPHPPSATSASGPVPTTTRALMYTGVTGA